MICKSAASLFATSPNCERSRANKLNFKMFDIVLSPKLPFVCSQSEMQQVFGSFDRVCRQFQVNLRTDSYPLQLGHMLLGSETNYQKKYGYSGARKMCLPNLNWPFWALNHSISSRKLPLGSGRPSGGRIGRTHPSPPPPPPPSTIPACQ